MSPEPHIHIIFVSEQAIPALVPPLAAAGAHALFPARRVLLMVTKAMSERADWLRDALRARDITVDRIDLPDGTDPGGLQGFLVERFLDLDNRHGDRVAVNLTGGTKLMALEAFAAARQLPAWPIYYLDHDRDSIVWLHGNRMPPTRLKFQGKIKDVLAVHGYTITNEPHRQTIPKELRTLGETLIQEHDRFEKALPTFNWACGEAGQTLISPNIEEKLRKIRNFPALVKCFEAAGLVEQKDGKLHFASERHRQLAGGGWLEEHVFSQLRNRQGKDGLRDLATGIEVRGPNGAPNEIDVACLSGNHLVLIECKAKRFDKEKAIFGQEAIDRLDTLAKAGGKGTLPVLCSYASLEDHLRQRAKQERIAVIEGKDLARIGEKLDQFLAERFKARG